MESSVGMSREVKTQDVSRLWVKTVQWLEPGPWFWRPNMTSNELDGFLILEG